MIQLGRFTIEALHHAMFVRLPFGEMFAERVTRGTTPLNPHPHGARWGLHRAAGEVFVYAGPVAAVLSRTRGL